MTEASVTQRVAKLLPRLASEFDGEVVATARALDRTLKGAGHDLHTLAQLVDLFGGSFLEQTPPIRFKAAAPTGKWPPNEPKPRPVPAPKWKNLSRGRQLAWLDILTIDSKITCGGLPHFGFREKFRIYRQRLINGGALNIDEIALVDRWIVAFFKWGARP